MNLTLDIDTPLIVIVLNVAAGSMIWSAETALSISIVAPAEVVVLIR